MLDKIYLEITNVCNLDCSFCHKTTRPKKLMDEEEFHTVLQKIEGRARYLFFHLMGEPTLHPQLPRFIEAARGKGFLPAITTNGSLLAEKGEALLNALPYKISISLHAPEANPAFSADGYLDTCIEFAKAAAARGCIIALRLWNLGSDADNTTVLTALRQAFPDEWHDIRGGSSQRLSTRIFLEWGERFQWPDPALPSGDPDADLFCYGLRDQIGILADGTVVPCCLDADANLALGNLFISDLDDILSSPRAKAIYDGFSRRRAVESLCRKCGYAERFSRTKK
ncbi:MAG: SPASM domain-containing protein [Clostridia bacterium]|nr:SPASM domain-containing protein [Clostridia bacterium]